MDQMSINYPEYQKWTFDMMLHASSKELTEINLLNHWVNLASSDDLYVFESARLGRQLPEVKIKRTNGDEYDVLNFGCYNYLGYAHHPEVIAAAIEGLQLYGLGASAAPLVSGKLHIHTELENALKAFMGDPKKSISLFTSGYGANVGAIQAFMSPGCHIVLDRQSHMSILEGARTSDANIHYFRHNDAEFLEKVLKRIKPSESRILVCTEGVFSTDGTYGNLKEIISVAKKYGAYVLVDEAHSTLIAGQNGRGVAEMENVLNDVDLYIMTFSKAFGGVGGALWASDAIIQYVNWYAKNRMFSCALDPAVTSGLIKVIELAQSQDGARRRESIKQNASYMRSLLRGKVDLVEASTWILGIIYGDESKTLQVNDYIQRRGLEASIIQFPAAPKNKARLRLFISSEHTTEHLDAAAEILLDAAKKFNFHKEM
jgi:glycine C-acetyltransferase